MQPTLKQQEVINRIANDSDGEIIVSFLKDITAYYADVRNLTSGTSEEVKARQLFCTILESEVISRFSRKTDKKIINEEFE